jgi:2-polyprenyl-6-methoxyphenol hydroxylase-like FAD-dependent oxidoreductase
MIVNDVDAVVVGAGPVGLMVACELRLAGLDVAVLERLAGIDPTIKAGALTVPALEALDRRGLGPAVQRAQEATLERMAAFRQQQGAPAAAGRAFVGHFAGIMLRPDRLDAYDPDVARMAAPGLIGLVNQQQLEAILAEHAHALGVRLHRGVTVTAVGDDGDGVTVTTDRGAVTAGWLVGCDGGRSLVRKQAGIDFPGTPPEMTAYQAVARMHGTEGLRPGWNVTATGAYAFGPMPGRILVAEFTGAPEDRWSAVTAAELEAAVRRVTGVEVSVEAVETATRFTDNARQAATYRRGRVLLAGDAAHVHSPFGGQGLSLGLGDAMNLGWKLAATVRGWAPPGLLDTYTAERHPVGRDVVAWTRAQIAVLRPDPHARAARAVVEGLAGTVDGTTYLVKRIAGVTVRYDLPGAHPLTGRSAPDLALDDGTRLTDHLHDGRALLLDLDDDPAVRKAGAGYEERLRVRTARAPEGAPAALLVRPDGVVAWASDGAEDPGDSLAAWLGRPAA